MSKLIDLIEKWGYDSKGVPAKYAVQDEDCIIKFCDKEPKNPCGDWVLNSNASEYNTPWDSYQFIDSDISAEDKDSKVLSFIEWSKHQENKPKNIPITKPLVDNNNDYWDGKRELQIDDVVGLEGFNGEFVIQWITEQGNVVLNKSDTGEEYFSLKESSEIICIKKTEYELFESAVLESWQRKSLDNAYDTVLHLAPMHKIIKLCWEEFNKGD